MYVCNTDKLLVIVTLNTVLLGLWLMVWNRRSAFGLGNTKM